MLEKVGYLILHEIDSHRKWIRSDPQQVRTDKKLYCVEIRNESNYKDDVVTNGYSLELLIQTKTGLVTEKVNVVDEKPNLLSINFKNNHLSQNDVLQFRLVSNDKIFLSCFYCKKSKYERKVDNAMISVKIVPIVPKPTNETIEKQISSDSVDNLEKSEHPVVISSQIDNDPPSPNLIPQQPVLISQPVEMPTQSPFGELLEDLPFPNFMDTQDSSYFDDLLDDNF